MNPRQIVLNLIEEWETKHTFPNLALKNALRNVKDERDRRFVTAVVYGVIERKITLDHFLSQCSDRKINRLSPAVLSVLRMGVYQMFYMQIPASAACNTSVDLIKKRGMSHSASFVNAVLRRCGDEKETLLALKKADFSVRYSIRPELVNLLLEQYGKETFVSIMEGISKTDTSIILFHNIKRGDEGSFLKKMHDEGIELEKTSLPHLFRSPTGFSVENSRCFREGWYHVVGEHSSEAALLIPKNCDMVMDLCAAPGGKSFILAAVFNGMVHSFDIHPHKVEQLCKSARRLGHKNLIATLADASIFNDHYASKADFVLCDVPCSGLGIIGKKPDIKYKEYDSTSFTTLQQKILQNGAKYLKSGGRLVYSTCTIDKRENEEIIKQFLCDNPDFSLDTAAISNGYHVYLPAKGSDGFFIAVLRKAKI